MTDDQAWLVNDHHRWK